MKILTTPTQQRAAGRLTADLFAIGGGRKTSMSMHLPLAGATWEAPDGSPGRIIYIAADRTSPDLDSIAPGPDRERIILVIPDGGATRDKATGAILTDWRKEMADICMFPWKEKYPDAVAIVYDTITEHAHKVLLENMKMDAFSDKGPTNAPGGIGPEDPRFRLIKESTVALGDKGDYRMVKEAVLQNIGWLLDLNSDLHVFCLFQEGTSDRDEKGHGYVIGPLIAGKSGPRDVPYSFGINLGLDVDPDRGVTRVQCQSAERRVANIHCPRPKEVPPFKLIDSSDPEEVRKFWLWVQALRA